MTAWFRLALLLGLSITGASATAHDFWLQPNRWRSEPGSTLDVTLLVGHGSDRQRSQIRASRILRVEAVDAAGAATDVRTSLRLGGPNGDLSFDANSSAPEMLLLVTDAKAESHLDAVRFNAYLEDEGLIPVLAWRTAHRMSDAEGSENYGRVAKVLLAPARTGASGRSIATRALGLELEIVPLADPYTPGARALPVQVLWRGSPLPGARVKLYELANDSKPRAVCRTDDSGRCNFDVGRQGSWLLNVVWSSPNAAGGSTDFRTIFSSLAFGFDPADREAD